MPKNSKILHHYSRYVHGLHQYALLYLLSVSSRFNNKILLESIEMKRLLFISMIILACMSSQYCEGQIFVSPTGSDKNIGTEKAPFATLSKALLHVRELRRLQDKSIVNGAHIQLQSGIYTLAQTIVIHPEDAGTVPAPTFIEAAKNAFPILSGGVTINGWHKVKYAINGLPANAQGKLWAAKVPKLSNQVFNFRELWVNNLKAIRARDNNLTNLSRIIRWNKQDGTCLIPTPQTPSLKNIPGIEMQIHQWWEIANLRVAQLTVQGDSTLLSFYQPESNIQKEHPWPAPWMSKETGNSAFYLTNAIQFLNEPGEWFLDVEKQELFYWPKENEDLSLASVIAGNLETLVQIEGTSDRPITNISFNGIGFAHTGWLRPSLKGHVPHQQGMFMLEAYKLIPVGTLENKNLDNQAWVGRPAAAVSAVYANNISFKNCQFEHLAATGLDYKKAIHDAEVSSNLFKDIGGTAIQAGMFSDENVEIHIPYHPKDSNEICNRISINNNLITDATNEDWGCVGIGIGYTKNTLIEHNEIAELNYSGISIGWGWTSKPNAMQNNRVIANKIHHFGKQMYDVGGIYIQSAQPGTIIEKNYIDSIYKAPYAHLPNHWFYLYADEGTSYTTFKNNWTPSTKYLQNANGLGNVWEKNGPEVASQIKINAGLEPKFQYLLKSKQTRDIHYSINKEQPVVIELVANEGAAIDINTIKEIAIKFKVDTTALYQWKNHLVIFDKVQDEYSFCEKIRATLPTVALKLYHDLVYDFNLANCSTTALAKEWSHTILTANLVADTNLQKEYLNYHKTQFEKWPEVAKGFCNAGFQQLLVLKNKRQLMLVISIPKGESLEQLNPLTTKDNPRMDKWNAIMKKYQEGIIGADKGVVWTFLKPVL
jgi:hypothetical protein